MNDQDILSVEEDEEHNVPYHWMEGDSLAPPCQTEYEVILTILQTLEPFITDKSVLYDLGCGDGRICLLATNKYNCSSVGVEIEPLLMERFQSKIGKSSLFQSKVKAVNDDLRNISFEDDADVIVLYLLPEAIELIKEKLIKALKRGCVLLCNSWGIKGVVAKEIIECGFANNVKLHLYTKECV
jgi:predicted RNA methylase